MLNFAAEMAKRSVTRTIYKVVRSLLFTAVAAIAGIYLFVYIALSVPSCQQYLRGRLESAASDFLGARISSSRLDVRPFNEVVLHDVRLLTPQGKPCADIELVGAGISIGKLIFRQKIELTYAEIIGMDAKIWQTEKGGPLNIQFLIDAFASKEKNKPPAKFDLKFRNIVIRRSSVAFDRLWQPRLADSGRLDPNHIKISDLKADVTLPRISNDNFIFDVRRISFHERSGFSIDRLSLYAQVTPREITVSELALRLPHSDLKLRDLSLSFNGFRDILPALKHSSHSVRIADWHITPSDFSAFMPALGNFSSTYIFDADVEISGNRLSVPALTLSYPDGSDLLNLSAEVDGIYNPKVARGVVNALDLRANAGLISDVLSIVPGLSDDIRGKIMAAGDVSLAAEGRFDLSGNTADGTLSLSALDCTVKSGIAAAWSAGTSLKGSLALKCADLDVSPFVADLGHVSADVSGDFDWRGGSNIDFSADGEIPFVEFRNMRLSNISVSAQKVAGNLRAQLGVEDPALLMGADASCLIAGAASEWKLDTDIDLFRPALFGLLPKYPDARVSGHIRLDASGDSPDNIIGSILAEDLSFAKNSGNSISLHSLRVTSAKEDGISLYTLDSDFLNGNVEGNFSLTGIVPAVRTLLASAFPKFIGNGASPSPMPDDLRFNFTLSPDSPIYSYLKLPVRPGVEAQVKGKWNASDGLGITFDAPYLIQGKDKLIRGFHAGVSGNTALGLNADISADLPVKKDRALLNVSVSALNDVADTGIGWQMTGNSGNRGEIGLKGIFGRNTITRLPDILVKIAPSSFSIGGADWTVNPASVRYADKGVEVYGLRVWHGAQFVDISGRASESPLDCMTAGLAGIDLNYIFDTLNINHVNFGGIATGDATASMVFSRTPRLEVKRLDVKNFSYNGALLGDAIVESHWDNDEKMVAINADVRDGDKASAIVHGGIYVARDSLSFDFDANKVNVALMQPFLSAFTSSVEGRASGRLKLYGTFSDVDLSGRIFVDTVSLLNDFTGVRYSGSDSIFFTKGRITIPEMRVYDRFGHSGLLKGVVTHRYLHDAGFEFTLRDARSLLALDTRQKKDEFWYGRVFANGNADLKGGPGYVTLDVNMSTAPKSSFTFELDESETALDYSFLTFSDKRKERLLAVDVKETFEDRFRKKMEESFTKKSDIFSMNLGLTVNPGCEMVLVMDPKAGDKIRAVGNGAIRMQYDTESDNFNLYGKYTLDAGNYNFSLQDLILRDFKIESGSSISFNGDPMRGILDITAAYRVNTNLTDLDKSFENDPDLNRTSIPVDALLRVSGDIQSPEIAFDLGFPTVTGEVERKVKSIISTEDMMNRQVIYLLVLNRFYTPEYSSSDGQGGELASVASSTLSSQISSIIGSLTDKFTIAPQFKSERSDFSDIEVDVALSSRLFDNRLLINGNLGYRDKATSQSTFIGDFDLEYLLNRSGSLRLKAYNHFNDASYYLKSALTTQGLGIMYRKEFDDPLKFLRKKPSKKTSGAKKNTPGNAKSNKKNASGNSKDAKIVNTKENTDRR